MAKYIGFNPPFIGGLHGVLSPQTDARLVKNDLLQLLLTLPGERIYRPTFGTQLRAVVFDQMTQDDVDLLCADIQAAIVNNDERIIVNSISGQMEGDGLSLSLKINVSLTDNPLTQYDLEIAYNSNGVVKLVK